MLKITTLFTAIFSLFSYSIAFSGATEYRCIIDTEINTKNESFSKDSVFAGSSFSVNRETGLITGQLVSDRNYDESIVINPGDSKNAFKVISYAYLDSMETKANIQYIYIASYDKASKKPFVYHNGLSLLSGYCL